MIERICIIAVLNLIFYAKTLRYKYCSDDIPTSQRPREGKFLRRCWDVLRSQTRSTPPIDHFVTTIIHTLVCVFIYTGFGSTDTSFYAALLFAFNPANNQASVWIAGRSYALPALGMTMIMTFKWLFLPLLVLITYFNAGFIAPVAFLGTNYWWVCIALPFVWAFQFKRFKENVGSKVKQEMFTEDKKLHPIKIVVALKTFGFYCVHAVFPIKTTFYHSYMQSMAGCGKDKAYSFKDRFLYIGIACAASILTYWIIVPWNTVSFALLFWCVCIAPFLNVVRIHQEIAERYMYLPNVGMMYVLASVIPPQYMPIAIAIYATKMWFYMDCYRDDYYLVEYACLNSIDAWFSWHVRAMKRWDARSHQEAVIFWMMAKNLSPKEFKLNFNIATALKLAKNNKEADEFMAVAEANIPGGQETVSKKLIEEWRQGKCAILL